MPTMKVRATCIACDTSVGMDWWTHQRTVGGSQQARCRDCFAEYVLTKRAPRVSLAGPTPTCVDCGGPAVSYHNSQVRCKGCSAERLRTYKTAAEARRRVRCDAGDKGIGWLALGERDGWSCHLCRRPVLRKAGTAYVPLGATVDHLIPIALDGSHTWDNVALAHRRCNVSRSTGGTVQLRLVG